MALSAGTRLGPYEILSPLGAGGMGEVYRARDTRLDRTVAIKVLPAHLSSDANLRARFEREAKAISALQHAHICVLYDVGKEAEIDLVEALHADGVKLVLVENLGRFARDLMVQESILHDLTRKGWQLVSVDQPDLCSNEPSRVLMRQMMGAFFQYEKAMIVAKLAGARARMRAKEGRCEGRKAFGHYPGEQAILDRMREPRASGMAYQDIATELNGDGIKPRAGELWYAGVIHGILAAGGRAERRP